MTRGSRILPLLALLAMGLGAWAGVLLFGRLTGG